MDPEQEQEPDSIQTLWLVRGTLFLIVGLAALIAAIFSADWRYYLFAAVAGLGLGLWEIWMAVTSMAADSTRRLTSPARVQSAAQGLRASGWASSDVSHSSPQKTSLGP
ncbi:MAG: hypothetical protein ACREPX_00345 [Rhodanobacteraceae bacterium]